MADIFVMAELLKGEYRKTFEQIALYGNMGLGSSQFIDDRMMKIYYLLTDAQENGKPVEKIVGNDLEAFCRDYFHEESKARLGKEIFKRMFHVAVLTLVLTAWEWIYKSKGVELQDAVVDLKPILIGVLVAGVLMSFGKLVRHRLMFRNDKTRPMAYYVIYLVLFLGGIILLLWATKGIAWQVSAVWALGTAGGYCVLHLLVMGVYRCCRYGNLRNPNYPSQEEKARQKAFRQELTLRSDRISSAKEMAKRFIRLQKKNKRRGKPEYTMEDFIRLMKRETNMGIGYKLFLLLWPVVGVLVPTIKVANAEGLLAATTVCVILSVLLFFVSHGIWIASKEVFVAQRAIIEECEQRGIHIVQYAAELEDS